LSLPCTARVQDTPAFPVPEHMRRQHAAGLADKDGAFVRFVGLEELFPGTGLSDLFDEDAAVRTELRRAAREDMFIPNPQFSDEGNGKIKDLKSSLMVGWKAAPNSFANLTGLFRARGLPGLDGPTFIGCIGGLVSGTGVWQPH